jgi:DNA modification methylase
VTVRILEGDCRDILRTLPDESAHCCVTSPPYFGLRDYGLPSSEWPEVEFVPIEGLAPITIDAMTCCLGLEPQPWAFIGHMVLVARELRRVLRDDATLWLNIGDSYANDGKWGGHTGGKHVKALHCSPIGRNKRYTGLKPKDMVGIPWMLAFALRADGWFLRQENIWNKSNPMPESVGDRCTKSHEQLFMLAKSQNYYFNQEAILEPASANTHARLAQDVEAQIGSARAHAGGKTNGAMKAVARGKSKAGEFGVKNNESFASAVCLRVPERNKRTVWTIATAAVKEAHFATFPPALAEPCILAGCPIGGTVLDPFGGAGTTGLVADRLQRDAILIELNPEYAAIARKRIVGDSPLFAEVA